MTFSILARDAETGAIGGAAATGSLCVGGWVLRGNFSAGMSASQGASPSTFWGEDVLGAMRDGAGARGAVARITRSDRGRDYRQLAALDLNGQAAGFTGVSNESEKGDRIFVDGIVSGNMLARIQVLEAMAAEFVSATGGLDRRLLAALRAAQAEGGDYRGTVSAALLVLHPARPPLTLRIDDHPDDPIGALVALHRKATTGAYAKWSTQVPTPHDRERVLD